MGAAVVDNSLVRLKKNTRKDPLPRTRTPLQRCVPLLLTDTACNTVTARSCGVLCMPALCCHLTMPMLCVFGGESGIVRWQEVPKPTVALEYTYGRRSNSTTSAKDIAHIWELGEATHVLGFWVLVVHLPVTCSGVCSPTLM